MYEQQQEHGSSIKKHNKNVIMTQNDIILQACNVLGIQDDNCTTFVEQQDDHHKLYHYVNEEEEPSSSSLSWLSSCLTPRTIEEMMMDNRYWVHTVRYSMAPQVFFDLRQTRAYDRPNSRQGGGKKQEYDEFV